MTTSSQSPSREGVAVGNAGNAGITSMSATKALGSPHKQISRFRSRYIPEIQSIMYTCGDVKNPFSETAAAVEELVHDCLVKLLRGLATSASKRGSRTIGPEDLLFYLRHDKSRLGRLEEYIKWREVRKLGSNKDADESQTSQAHYSQQPSQQPAGLEDVEQTGGQARRKPAPRLPWTLTSSIIDPELLQQGWQEGDDQLLDSIDDLLFDDCRAKMADALTKAMTREEYLEWAECRQASFTYKKQKKFREWLSPTSCTDYRVGDELVEMLGLLACMMVESLTLTASQVREEDEDDIGESLAINTAFAIPVFQKPSAKTGLLVNHIRKAYFRLANGNEYGIGYDVLFRIQPNIIHSSILNYIANS